MRQRTEPRPTRIGALSGIDEILDESGVDARAILAEAGMEPMDLSSGDRLVDANDFARLLAACVRATGRARLPLELAARQQPSFLGTLGLLLLTARTIGESIEELIAYHHVHAPASSWSRTILGAEVTLEFRLDAWDLSTNERTLCAELALAQCAHGLSRLGRSPVHPLRVEVRCSRADRAAAYERFFRAPIAWESPRDSLVYPSAVLDFPLLQSDVGIHDALRTLVARADETAGAPAWAGAARAVIRALLPSGRCNVDRVARCLGCDKRTLQRHLRAEGSETYRVLLDQARFEIAEGYLDDSQMPIAQIARAAGYSDPSNFSSAFRRRYGCSPRRWRARSNRRAPLKEAGDLPGGLDRSTLGPS